MPSARLSIKLGRGAKDYARITGPGAKYKRGSVTFRPKGESLEVAVTASDAVALLASLNSALKQLRVVAGVDKAIGRLSAKKSPSSIRQRDIKVNTSKTINA